MKLRLALSAIFFCFSAAQAQAAPYSFTFQTITAFFGPDQNGSGVFTTSDTSTQIDGRTAYAITGISGQINNVPITGLTSSAVSLIPTYYYFTEGPTFLSGTGVHFNAGAFQDIRFYAPSASPGTYSVSGNGTILANVAATSSAITAATPEPTTWSMLILGFGLAGSALRRWDFRFTRRSVAKTDRIVEGTAG